MSKKYVALKAIQSKSTDGNPLLIEPKSDKHSGLFTAQYTPAQEARLKGLGAIRDPEGAEGYEKITGIEVVERRDAEQPPAQTKVPKGKGGKKADEVVDPSPTPSPAEVGGVEETLLD